MEEKQQKSKIEIVEISKNNSLDSSDSNTSLALTFFDIRWLRLPPVQRLFFYELSVSKSSFHSDLLPRLKRSLSLALTLFPFAGNLIWPESHDEPFVVRQDGDGVSLAVAESKGVDFHLVSGGFNGEFVEVEATHPLIPTLAETGERAELLSLQITLFPDAGICIGISSHHAFADGKTSTSFMRAWAHLFRSQDLPPELKPFCDKTVIEDPLKLKEAYAKAWRDLDHGPNNRSLLSWKLKPAPPGHVRGTFTLTNANLAKLRETIGNKLGDEDRNNIRLSAFCLAFAYSVVCGAVAKGIESGVVLLVINYDCRSRMSPALPENYFGNCIGSRICVIQDPKTLRSEDGLVVAVKAIAEALASLDRDGALAGAEGWAAGLIAGFAGPKDGSVNMFGVAGSNRFDVYGTDFGWGRPRKVEMVSVETTGAYVFSDSRDELGGIEIGLVRERNEMEAFASLFARGLVE